MQREKPVAERDNVAAEERARKTARKGTLAEFLLASPLRRADLELERQDDLPRDVTL